jgi:hypothetical protein
MAFFKIVAHDNLDRDTVSEWLVCENFQSEDTAEEVCKFLNITKFKHSDYYLFVRPQDRPLYVWEP